MNKKTKKILSYIVLYGIFTVLLLSLFGIFIIWWLIDEKIHQNIPFIVILYATFLISIIPICAIFENKTEKNNSRR